MSLPIANGHKASMHHYKYIFTRGTSYGREGHINPGQGSFEENRTSCTHFKKKKDHM